MKEFIKASDELLLTAKYELENGEIERLCHHILYTFNKLNVNEDIDKRIKDLKEVLDLKYKENNYKVIHGAYWYLKNKNIEISSMADFAKIVDNLNDEIYDIKQSIKKGNKHGNNSN